MSALSRPSVDSEDTLVIRHGKVAGILFIAAALGALPSLLFADASYRTEALAITALACASGVLCLRAPWERLSRRWLHVATAAATFEVALVAGLADQIYSWFFLLVAVYAGYAFATRRDVALQTLLICAALLTPLVYESGTTDETLTRALIAIPIVLLAAGLVTYLRECFEANQAVLGELATRDALTGVGNYRSFRRQLAQEVARHTRHERELALVVIDLVGFKQINERLGHLEGDHVLQQVGRTLAAEVRVEDLVARQGGDEFSVIAPDTGAHGAALLASRIEDAVRDITAGGRRVRASTGWAVFPTDGRTPDALLANADEALRAHRRENHRALAGRAGAGTVDLAKAAIGVTGRATRRRRQ